jgi:iron complex outermembrane recepter protein
VESRNRAAPRPRGVAKAITIAAVKPPSSRLKIASALCALLFARGAAAGDVVAITNLNDLTLEQLTTIDVTSVSGRPQSLRSAAASIYVITAEEIRRSAATSLPEALRLAPNLQVARLNSGQYAISARGFNNAIANKLLVLIDGRTVYSSLFSGVFWDYNDVMLDDIDRIEVISGPAGTIWGANAVNGVINIVTRPAADTQGPRVSVTRSSAGGQESARWGGKVGDAHLRVYGMSIDRANTRLASGVARADASAKQQAGFRADFDDGVRQLTVQGDAFTAGDLPATNLAPQMHGGNLLARWDSRFADGSSYRVQGSYDLYARDETTAFRNQEQTVDLQFTHEPLVRAGHHVLWGGGWRSARDRNDPSALLAFIPADRTLAWWNLFVQDQIALGPRVQLTLGAKGEHNSYTGLELLPEVRLAYTHPGGATTWAALSRAVRAPSRIDRDFFIPAHAPYIIAGGPQFHSETADVLEAGHRANLGGMVSYDATVFRQQYRGLRGGDATVPTTIQNRIDGHVDGLEAWGTWQPTPGWRLSAGLLKLHKSLHYAANPPPNAATSIANLGNDPEQQWKLRSQLDLGGSAALDITARRVGALPAPAVPAYTAVDARLAWTVRPDLEISLLAQNLFDAGHVEFNAPATASVIRRQFFLRAVWQR